MSWYLLVFGIALPWFALGIGCWILSMLVCQNGRILLRLDALEERLKRSASSPGAAAGGRRGLPVGAVAPEFALPALSGSRQSLAEFRGQTVLLIFFNPRCGYCTRMAPDLAALPVDGAEGQPIPLVVTTGGEAENRKLVEQHGLRCPVLLQEQAEILSRFQAGGTPTGYLIDAEGRIASELAVGAEALLELAVVRHAPDGHATRPAPHKEHKGNRSLAESRLNRGGLEAGTPAPPFSLPRLDGGQLSLQEYRGRRVLLVFSDPKCGPCDALAPPLEQAHRRSGDVQVVMVSRGDAGANRAKVQQQGLTFPVVLQRQWEVSRDYAMFATPVGYLIDENGIITAPVAAGADAILSLLTEATAGSRTNGTGSRCRCGKLAGQCGCGRTERAALRG